MEFEAEPTKLNPVSFTWFSSDWKSQREDILKSSAGGFYLWQGYREKTTLTYTGKASLHKCKVLEENFS